MYNSYHVLCSVTSHVKMCLFEDCSISFYYSHEL
uniref:Uncharacterized protein n=1 Tax=Arundo donax TaxID=35708 RepID=A0A0A9DHG9_ARUDO